MRAILRSFLMVLRASKKSVISSLTLAPNGSPPAAGPHGLLPRRRFCPARLSVWSRRHARICVQPYAGRVLLSTLYQVISSHLGARVQLSYGPLVPGSPPCSPASPASPWTSAIRRWWTAPPSPSWGSWHNMAGMETDNCSTRTSLTVTGTTRNITAGGVQIDIFPVFTVQGD